MPPRYAPANPLPPYAYVPGHDLPRPENDPSGHGENPGDAAATLGLAPDSLASVVAALEKYRPECGHTSRTPVVRVVACELRLAEQGQRVDTSRE